MSQVPPSSNYPNYAASGAAQPAQTNGLGLAGFITSLVGLVTCGFISPIGLLLSLIGLTKRPRGFAAAGTVLGLVGTLVLVFWGLAFVMTLVGVKKGVETVIEYGEVLQTGRQAYEVIDKQRQADKALPGNDAGNRLIQSYTDKWSTPLKYERAGETFSLVSAGKDKSFGTADDLRFTEDELKAPDFSTTASTTDETEETEEEEMEEDEGTGVDDATTDDATTDDATTDDGAAGDAETP